MYDYRMTDEQKEYQRIAHEFARDEIRPISLELDHQEDPLKCAYMPHLLEKLDKTGLRTMSIPKLYGRGPQGRVRQSGHEAVAGPDGGTRLDGADVAQGIRRRRRERPAHALHRGRGDILGRQGRHGVHALLHEDLPHPLERTSREPGTGGLLDARIRERPHVLDRHGDDRAYIRFREPDSLQRRRRRLPDHRRARRRQLYREREEALHLQRGLGAAHVHVRSHEPRRGRRAGRFAPHGAHGRARREDGQGAQQDGLPPEPERGDHLR